MVTHLRQAARCSGRNLPNCWVDTFNSVTIPGCFAAGAAMVFLLRFFLFVGQWNALQLPLIYLQSRDVHTLPMAILNLFNPQQTSQPWTLIMTTFLVAVVPLVLVLAVQRYFVESIVLTGTKG